MKKSQTVLDMENSLQQKKVLRHRLKIQLAQVELDIKEYQTQLNYLKDLERREKALEEIYYGVDELERSNQIIKGGRLNEKRN